MQAKQEYEMTSSEFSIPELSVSFLPTLSLLSETFLTYKTALER